MMQMARDRLRRALEALGAVLADRGIEFHIAIAGGAALLLRGHGSRPTQDVDVVSVAAGRSPLLRRHILPEELRNAAQDVADVMDLDPGWLNAGALGVILHHLPDGFEERLVSETFGNLRVSVLSREDLVRLKLLAAADEGPGSVHLGDLAEMSLNRRELIDAASWVRSRYPAGPLPELDQVVEVLERRLDD